MEKPQAPVATELMGQGGVWNSFILAARGKTLLELFDHKLPGLAATLQDALARDMGAQQLTTDAHADLRGTGQLRLLPGRSRGHGEPLVRTAGSAVRLERPRHTGSSGALCRAHPERAPAGGPAGSCRPSFARDLAQACLVLQSCPTS